MYLNRKFIMIFTAILFFITGLFAQDKTVVAIFDLEAQGIQNTDANIITNRIRAELKKTDVYNIMEREMMEEILKEQAFQLTGICSNTSCLVEVGKIIAVQQRICGSVGDDP